MCAAVSVPVHLAILSVSWRGGEGAFAFNRALFPFDVFFVVAGVTFGLLATGKRAPAAQRNAR